MADPDALSEAYHKDRETPGNVHDQLDASVDDDPAHHHSLSDDHHYAQNSYSEPNMITTTAPSLPKCGNDPPAYGTDIGPNDGAQPRSSFGFPESLHTQYERVERNSTDYSQRMPASGHDFNGQDATMQLEGGGRGHAEGPETTHPFEPALCDMEAGQKYGQPEQYPRPEPAPAPAKKSKKAKKTKKKKTFQPKKTQEDVAPTASPHSDPINHLRPETEPKSMQEQAYGGQQYDHEPSNQLTYANAQYGQQQPELGQQCSQQQDSEMKDDQQQYEQPEYVAQDSRSTTPQQDVYTATSSPHGRLNEGLQAAVWSPQQMATRTEVPTSLEDRSEPGVSCFQTNRSFPMNRPQRQLNATARDPEAWSRQITALGRNDTSQTPTLKIGRDSGVGSSSSDIEEGFKRLFHKVSEKAAEQAMQLTADKDSLKSELYQALTAKHALEDQISILQQDKETLASSLEQGNARHGKLFAQAQKLQTFTNGIGKDIETLRTNAESYRLQSQAMAKEGSHQMSRHVEESRRLHREVVKQCQAAKYELSTAATRTAHLEANLKERCGALAEEKKLRLQLQVQLNSVEHVEDTISRQLKSNSDGVLDKLYEIHAALEDTDNRQEITEMLDKTATAIQGLNLQQATTVDEVVSVKGIMEALTEGISQSANDRSSQDEEKISALQSRIKELETEHQSKASEVSVLQEKLKNPIPPASISNEAVETIRKDAIAFQAQQHAQMENELKKLRARPAKEEIVRLKQELAELKRSDDSHQQHSATLSEQLGNEERAHQQNIDKLHEQLANQKHDFERQLQSRPTQEELTAANEQRSEAQRLASARHQDIDALSTQIEKGKSDLSAARRAVDSVQQELDRRNEQLQNERIEHEKKLSAAKEELSKVQRIADERKESITSLTAQLDKEKENSKRLETGFGEYKTSCDAEVAKEKHGCGKRVEAIQQELAKSKKEIEIKTKAEEKFHFGVHEAWKSAQDGWDRERATLQEKLEDTKQQLEDAKLQLHTATQKATQLTQQGDQRSSSPVIEESQQRDDVQSFAQINARFETLNYVNTQHAADHLQSSIYPDNRAERQTTSRPQKTQAAPNSSSKRSATPPSSDPDFVASHSRRKSTMDGVGSSGRKRRSSHGKEASKIERPKPGAAKRKAYGDHVKNGYEDERRKRIKAATSSQPFAPSQRLAPSQTSVRSPQTSVPNRSTLPSTHSVGPSNSSQGGYGGRVTRSKTEEMNLRFSKELQPNRGGYDARR